MLSAHLLHEELTAPYVDSAGENEDLDYNDPDLEDVDVEDDRGMLLWNERKLRWMHATRFQQSQSVTAWCIFLLFAWFLSIFFGPWIAWRKAQLKKYQAAKLFGKKIDYLLHQLSGSGSSSKSELRDKVSDNGKSAERNLIRRYIFANEIYNFVISILAIYSFLIVVSHITSHLLTTSAIILTSNDPSIKDRQYMCTIFPNTDEIDQWDLWSSLHTYDTIQQFDLNLNLQSLNGKTVVDKSTSKFLLGSDSLKEIADDIIVRIQQLRDGKMKFIGIHIPPDNLDRVWQLVNETLAPMVAPKQQVIFEHRVSLQERVDPNFYLEMVKIYVLEFFVGLAIVIDLTIQFFYSRNKWNLLKDIYFWIDCAVAYGIFHITVAEEPSEAEYKYKYQMFILQGVGRFLRLRRAFRFADDLDERASLGCCGTRFSMLYVRIGMLIIKFILFICATASLLLFFEKPCQLLKEGACEFQFQHFVHCVFYIVGVLTTTGYGDIQPGTNYGRVLSLLVFIVGISRIPFELDAIKRVWNSGNKLKKNNADTSGDNNDDDNDEDVDDRVSSVNIKLNALIKHELQKQPESIYRQWARLKLTKKVGQNRIMLKRMCHSLDIDINKHGNDEDRLDAILQALFDNKSMGLKVRKNAKLRINKANDDGSIQLESNPALANGIKETIMNT